MLKDRLTKLNLFNSGHIYLDQKPMTKFRVIWLYQEYKSHISLNKAEISLWLPEQKTASVGWNKVNGWLFMLWLTLPVSKTFYRRLTSIYIFRCAVVWLYSLVLLYTFSQQPTDLFYFTRGMLGCHSNRLLTFARKHPTKYSYAKGRCFHQKCSLTWRWWNWSHACLKRLLNLYFVRYSSVVQMELLIWYFKIYILCQPYLELGTDAYNSIIFWKGPYFCYVFVP